MDSTERLLSETLRRAAGAAPAPSGVLTTPTHATSARSLPRTALATAAAAMVIIGMSAGGAALLGSRSSGPATSSTAAPTTEAGQTTSSRGPRPAPLIGDDERVVTLGQAALPLPQGWTVYDSACGEPHSNTVSVFPLGSGPFALCTIGRPPHVSEIQMWELGDPHQRSNVRLATAPVTLQDGSAGRIGQDRSAGGIVRYPGDSPKGYTTVVLVVPERKIVLVGDGPDASTLRAAMLRLTGIPAIRAVVPELGIETAQSARARLSGLGLDLEVVPARVSHGTGRITWQRPRPGMAVLRGSTVTIAVDR